MWPAYQALIATAVQRDGLVYHDLNPALRLQASEFSDRLHLAAAGRQRWTDAFVQWLATH